MNKVLSILSNIGRVVVMVFIAAILSSNVLSAQNTKTQETKKARLQKEIAVLDQQLKENSTKSNKALSNLTLVRKKISNRKELIEESDKDISFLSHQIDSTQKEIDITQAELDTMSYYYNKLIRNAYKNRDAKIWYMYILASDNLGQAFRRFGYLRDLSSQMNVQATKIKEVKAELEDKQASLSQMKSQAESMRQARVAELDQLQSDETASEKLISQLKKDKSKIQSEINSKQKQVDALNREIEKIIREAMQGGTKKSSSSKTTQPIDYKLAGEFKANKGKLPWPLDGPVVDHYGQHYHPVYKNVKLPFNNGVTIAAAKGAQVKAIFDGVVKNIMVVAGYNQCILVQHGDYFSFYCKMGGITVKPGDKVKTGQVLGTVDTINGETQLHLQVWSGNTPQNPETWLRPR